MFDLERLERELAAKSDAELYEMMVSLEEVIPEAYAAVKKEFERRDGCERMLAAKSDAELYEMMMGLEEFAPEAHAAVKKEFERRDLAPADLADESSLTPSELLLLDTPSRLLLSNAPTFFPQRNELDERVSEDAALRVLLAAFVANEEPITVHFPEKVRDQLKILAVEQRTTMQNMLAEALNDLFAKYRKPKIAPKNK